MLLDESLPCHANCLCWPATVLLATILHLPVVAADARAMPDTLHHFWLLVAVPRAAKQAKRGGEGGIRTPGTSLNQYHGLANRCFQPLSHLSTKNVPRYTDTLGRVKQPATGCAAQER